MSGHKGMSVYRLMQMARVLDVPATLLLPPDPASPVEALDPHLLRDELHDLIEQITDVHALGALRRLAGYCPSPTSGLWIPPVEG
jgi:hypothetical protein